MTIPRLRDAVFVTSATLALLAGSAMVAATRTAAVAAPSAFAPGAPARQAHGVNARTGWLSSAAISGPVIYVSTRSVVEIYSQNGQNQQPIGEITQGINRPFGLAVDSGGNLYVASEGSNSVLMFQKGHLAPSKTYTTGINNPISVAVGKDGTVYVANSGSYGHLGTVGVYRNGSTKPSATIEDFDGMALGVTTYESNDLLVSYISGFTSTGQLNIYAPGSTSGRNLGVTLNAPYGITVDGRDDYVVADEHESVGIFSPAAKLLGSFNSFSPLAVAFNSTQNVLYTAESNNGVVVRAYPSGKVINTIGHVQIRAVGVALSPAAPR